MSLLKATHNKARRIGKEREKKNRKRERERVEGERSSGKMGEGEKGHKGYQMSEGRSPVGSKGWVTGQGGSTDLRDL